MIKDIPQSLSDNYHVKRLVHAVQELSLARSLDDVMKIVRTVARELTGADGATFILKDGDSCYYAEEDAISPLWKGSRFPMKNCISGWAMLNRKAAIIEDIYSDSRIPIDAYKPTFVKSLALVPIRTIDPIGAIGNYWAKPHLPTEDELTLLQSLADITAVTLENVKIYQELEQRIKERTNELESLNKELESFSYSVSHDLRTPLRSIIGYAKILAEGNFERLDDEGKNALGSVQRCALRMNELINDLLEFARLGKKELTKEKVPMFDLVESIVFEINNSLNHKAKIEIDSSLPMAYCDVSLIKQVWFNLISNAVKYSSKKENPIINIGYRRGESENMYYIKDNGAGFKMEYVNKLFEVFQRLHAADEYEGTGIGLALVKKIIDKHNGKVGANSKIDEGATFYFTLPEKEPHL